MRRILKLAAGALGIVVAIYAIALATLAWQLRTITDVAKYEELLGRCDARLTGHFPAHIPVEATKRSLSFFPGFLQGGAYLQLRVELPAAEVAREEARMSELAIHVHPSGERSAPPGLLGEIPLPPFYTGDAEPSASFPDEYALYFLLAQPGDSVPWNHGQTAGIAISQRRSELVYWAESW